MALPLPLPDPEFTSLPPSIVDNLFWDATLATYDRWKNNPKSDKPGESSDPVEHPEHYETVVPGIEAIQVTRHFSFTRGNAMKYLWRAGSKGDDPIEDLKKAIWYIQDEIKQLEAKNGQG